MYFTCVLLHAAIAAFVCVMTSAKRVMFLFSFVGWMDGDDGVRDDA